MEDDMRTCKESIHDVPTSSQAFCPVLVLGFFFLFLLWPPCHECWASMQVSSVYICLFLALILNPMQLNPKVVTISISLRSRYHLEWWSYIRTKIKKFLLHVLPLYICRILQLWEESTGPVALRGDKVLIQSPHWTTLAIYIYTLQDHNLGTFYARTHARTGQVRSENIEPRRDCRLAGICMQLILLYICWLFAVWMKTVLYDN